MSELLPHSTSSRVFGIVGFLSGALTLVALKFRYEPFVTPGVIFALSVSLTAGYHTYREKPPARAVLDTLAIFVALCVGYVVASFLLLVVAAKTAHVLSTVLPRGATGRLSFAAGLLCASGLSAVVLWLTLRANNRVPVQALTVFLTAGMLVTITTSLVDWMLYWTLGIAARDSVRDALILVTVFLLGNTVMAGLFGRYLRAPLHDTTPAQGGQNPPDPLR